MIATKFPFLGIGLAVAALGCATQASANATLLRSNPAPNATVPSIKAIALSFNETLVPASATVKVTVVGGKSLPVKTSMSHDHRTVLAVLPEPLGAGAYKVSWSASSVADTHPTKGDLAFRVK